MGRKHQLMIELGTRLGAGDRSKAEIITLLGSPDVVAREGDDLFDQIDNLLALEESATSSARRSSSPATTLKTPSCLTICLH